MAADNDYIGPLSATAEPVSRAEPTPFDPRGCRWCKDYEILERNDSPIIKIEYDDSSGRHHRHGYNPELGPTGFEPGEKTELPEIPHMRYVLCDSCHQEVWFDADKSIRPSFCVTCKAEWDEGEDA